MEVHISSNNPLGVIDVFISYKTGSTRYMRYYNGDEYEDKAVDEYGGLLPTFRLERETFQALVDAIHARHKPSEGKFTEGKLEATERHLEDMRKLVFKNK